MDKDSATAFLQGWQKAGRDGAVTPELRKALVDEYGIHPDRAQQWMDATMSHKTGRGPKPDPREYMAPIVVSLNDFSKSGEVYVPSAKNLSGVYRAEADAEQEAPSEQRRIVSDCNGTLLMARSGEPVNMQLLTFLSSAKKLGFDVVIASNDASGNEEILKIIGRRHFGDPDYFGEVKYKDELSGAEAFIVFDDDHTSHKIKGENLLDPTNTFVLGKLNAELLERLGGQHDFKRGAPVISYDPM